MGAKKKGKGKKGGKKKTTDTEPDSKEKAFIL